MIGARLGNWVIDEELGRGGMGAVYLAHETSGESTVSGPRRMAAVKVLSARLAQVDADQRFIVNMLAAHNDLSR